ncbi:MAG: Crp/Fnr family transcriptional regulator [Mangrovicoccus sp.]
MSDRQLMKDVALLFKDHVKHPKTHAALKALVNIATPVSLRRDMDLDPGRYLVAEGYVSREIAGHNGDIHIAQIFAAGELFKVPAPDQAAGLAHRGLTSTRLVKFSDEGWDEIVQDFPNLALMLMTQCEAACAKFARRMASLMGDSVRTRLARYLLEQSDGSQEMRLELRQYDLARYFGVQPETITRTIRALADEGLIAHDHTKITLREPEILTEIAAIS